MSVSKNLNSIRTSLFFALVLTAFAGNSREPELEELVITNADGNSFTYQVEVASTPAQKQRGLMFRDSMPDDHGMLFIYLPERVARMWMKNTILSLDMLFIDANGQIVNIAESTEPYSLRTIESAREVRAVLELNAGEASKNNIRAGDQVKHGLFDGV